MLSLNIEKNLFKEHFLQFKTQEVQVRMKRTDFLFETASTSVKTSFDFFVQEIKPVVLQKTEIAHPEKSISIALFGIFWTVIFPMQSSELLRFSIQSSCKTLKVSLENSVKKIRALVT